MKKYGTNELRNVVFIGHTGSGKTSLVEAMLFLTGRTERLCRVDNGSSVMDFEPEELKRNSSLSTAINHCIWMKQKINIIDTPGDPNFGFDALSGLQVADGAVLVIDAVDGVKTQTEKLSGFAAELGRPMLVFISKMDRERANYKQVLEEIKQILGLRPILLTYPLGEAENFRGVVDLTRMKALEYADAASGKYTEKDVSSELADEAKEFRFKLVEDAAESDDALMEKYLEEEELSAEEIFEGLKKGVGQRAFIPVICGSSINLMGIQPLLDMIVKMLPSPAETLPARGSIPSDGEAERKPDPSEPFSALVFKTIADPYTGRLTLMRVYSGTINADSTVYNVNKGVRERVGQLLQIEGKGQQSTESADAGEIVAVAKLKETLTGDTLADEKAPISYQGVIPPVGTMAYAIAPRSKGDEDKVSASLQRLMEEDPTLCLRREEQTKEFILSCMGQVHVQVTREKLARKFGVQVDLKAPKIPYKETIKAKASAQGKYKRQTGGRGQYGDTWLEIEPLPRGTGFEFVDKIVGGAIPRQYIPAVEKGVVEAMAGGVLAGFPMTDIRVTLYDGSFHDVDSSEMAFKIAGSMGFKKACQSAKMILLEPIMNMEIVVPEDNMGDIMGDLNSRRGRIMGMDQRGKQQIIKAQAPLAEILEYSADLTSKTSGRGSFTVEFSHYEEVPAMQAEKIIQANKVEQGEN
ncbi:MAG: elongation factor G [Deltaproteobacteria bacterium]|nr:elongation factor G [Deltaproteobacteria bacterium]